MSEAIHALPEGWTEAPVGEVFRIVGGGTPSTREPAFWDGDIPWITSADIGEDHVIRPKRSIAAEAIEASATNRVPAGSVIVVTRVGLGKVGLAESDLTFSQDSQALVFDPEVLDPRFVVHQMGRLVGVFKNISRGTTISGVTKEQLRALPFRVPPIVEQRRIVSQSEALLARVDAVRTRLKRVPDILRRFRQSVLAAACDGRLTADWRAAHADVEPAGALLERIAAERQSHLGKTYRHPELPPSTNLRELPEGWVWVTIETIAETTSGGTPSRSNPSLYGGDIPWVKSGELGDALVTRTSETITDAALRESSAKLFAKGTLLLAMYGATVGKLGVLGMAAATNQAVCALFLEEGVLTRYAFLHLLSLRSRLIEQGQGGAQPNISQGIIRSTEFALPPTEEQAEIVRRADALLALADRVEARLKKARRHAEHTAEAVLSRAFRGALVPTEAMLARAEGRAYESGAVLLEKLRATPTAPRGRRRAARSQLAFEIFSAQDV